MKESKKNHKKDLTRVVDDVRFMEIHYVFRIESFSGIHVKCLDFLKFSKKVLTKHGQ